VQEAGQGGWRRREQYNLDARADNIGDGLPIPDLVWRRVRRVSSIVPQPSAVTGTMRARQTYFCRLLARSINHSLTTRLLCRLGTESRE
jgi:hypothetical protein